MLNKIMKRLLVLSLAAAMVLGNLSVASAGTLSSSAGGKNSASVSNLKTAVTGTVTGGGSITADGAYTIDSGATGTITVSAANVTLIGGGSTAPYTTLSIVCTNAGTKLTIQDVYINDTATNANAIDFTGTGNYLYLASTNMLIHGSSSFTTAAIHVGPSAGLTLADAPGDGTTGTLYYFNMSQGAGIGSNQYEPNGKITVESGNFYGLGQKWGALIGSGSDVTTAAYAGEHTPGDISVKGGSVNLISSASGTVGIGGSSTCTGGTNPGNIYISGGSIMINRNNATPVPIGGAAYASSSGVAGHLVITGGSIKTYVDTGIATPAGVSDAAITISKVNDAGTAVSMLKMDTAGISGSSYNVTVDGKAYATGGLHTSQFANQDTTKAVNTAMSTFAANWTASTDKTLYLYVTQADHVITVNGRTYQISWSSTTGTFTQQEIKAATGTTGKGGITVSNQYPSSGDTVTVTATPDDGYYLAQVRLADMENGTTAYSVLQKNQDGTYSFTMPAGSVKVYADFISKKWDGTIDLTWYDPNSSTYNLQYPAQLAGAAALTDGLFNNYPMKSDGNGNSVPDVDANGNPSGYSSSLYNEYKTNSSASPETAVVGDSSYLKAYSSADSEYSVTTHTYWYGAENFSGKTINLSTDMDMGGSYVDSKVKLSDWNGPNYMPIGGQYSMDPSNGYSRIKAGFNGTFNGQGHMVSGIYCARTATNSGDSIGVGLIGSTGILITDHPELFVNPVIENVAVDGYISGTSKVGGIVGHVGYSNGTKVENCLNFATVGNGLIDAGGIVGYGSETNIVDNILKIKNCANYGYISATGNDISGIYGDGYALTYSSYNLGYVGSSNTASTNGQALGRGFYTAFTNCYWLTGSGQSTDWPALAGTPGQGASYPGTSTEISSASTFKTSDFLTELNANTRDWVISGDSNLISSNLENALQNMNSLSSQLNAYNALGVAVPRTFLNDGTSAVPVSIDITGSPVTEYISGQTFKAGTLKLWAHYSDGTKEEITDYTVNYAAGGNAIAYGDTKVSISVTHNGKSFTGDYPITVTQNQVLSIAVTTAPTNVLYASDEAFDPSGMIVEATYSNGNTAEIKDYTYTPTGTLSSQDSQVKIEYSYQGKTVTANQDITVLASEAPSVITDSDGKKTVQIKSSDDLRWFANQVSTGVDTSLNAELCNDVDLAGTDWIPVGATSDTYKISYYEGTFDGNGKTITMQYHPSSSVDYRGILFSGIKAGAVVEDVTVAGSATNILDCGLVSDAEGGKIINCINKAEIVNRAGYGGSILGYGMKGVTVQNCVNLADISSTDTASNFGGIAGGLEDGSAIDNCRNYGSVSANGYYVGGILGIIFATDIVSVKNCANYGDITTTFPCDYASGTCTGGIIGYAYASGVFDSNYNAGDITAAGGSAGGIIAYAKSAGAQITNCYNTGDVTLTTVSDGAAKNSDSTEICAGGIAGQLNDAKATVSNCYDTGKISLIGASSSVGAVFGYAPQDALTNVSNNLALKGSASALMANNSVYGSANAAFIADSELKNSSIQLGSAYMANTLNINNGYPLLSWQAKDTDTVSWLIEAIGEVNADSSPLIMAAKNAYDTLDSDSKTKVSNYSILTAAMEQYTNMVSAADSVDTLISDIGTVTASSGKAITAARAAYEALTAEEQKLVTKLDVLTAAEQKYAEFSVSYKIVFDANSGTKLSSSGKTLINGSNVGTLPTVVRSGFTFVGWYTSKTGGDKISSATICTKDATYYAHWTKVSVGTSKITKLIAGSKTIKVYYNAVSAAKGYQISYSLKANMSSASSVATTAISKSISGLKKDKRYYLQVRAYKIDSTGSKVYGSWCTKKSVSVK